MNYGQLKAAVTGYLHRSDGGSMMDMWLALAEARIYYGEQNTPALRIAAMSKTVDLATSAKPDDFLEARLIHVAGDAKKPLDLVSLTDVATACRGYSWDGQTLALSSDQELPVTLTYYAKFAPLVDDSDTNALLTIAPGIYLSSMLIDAARWSRDNELGIREAANYASAVNALNSSDKAAKYSGSLLTIKPNRRVA